MSVCYFVSDLHGSESRFQKLFQLIETSPPRALFVGGDLLPSGSVIDGVGDHALSNFILPALRRLRNSLQADYPTIFVILGNDDPAAFEPELRHAQDEGLIVYAHDRRTMLGEFSVVGYSYVPPTPFRLKDWERYDVSRFTDPGCISPESGFRTVPISEREARYRTIRDDLTQLAEAQNAEKTIWLFHTPPYRTELDRAPLDGRLIEHVPLDVNVGSIAVRELIQQTQPAITLHGHVHESARITGSWHDAIGRTHLFSAAHDGPELAVIRFDPNNPSEATRQLL